MGNRLRHLGVIMDGNRRWAKAHMLASVLKGHEKGVQTFIDLCRWCKEEGIHYLTVYAFSTENWNRSEQEVSGLFRLMNDFFRKEVETCIREDIRMVIVGDLNRLNDEQRRTVEATMEQTRHCKTLVCQVAISYGGRDEIVRAAEKCIDAALREQAEKGAHTPLTEEVFAAQLDTAGTPDIDLVIRTGGNKRLSNFFPWQTVYSEIWFTDTLWPDFTKEELQEALRAYENVQINKGK